jgi:predicted NACHT family NTPase
MWVFSDHGTTASGEKLYAFTHRTFLEYFAAAQLAYSDTPENLARTLPALLDPIACLEAYSRVGSVMRT